tara:strand:- start:388 stop:555 length:168 start_codon:yes stop_codon:yes gene_type:complete
VPWFTVEYEITILGKDMLVVNAPDKDTATQIAARLIKKNNNIVEGAFQITTIKEN